MTIQERYSGIQTVMGMCNKYGCHFLVLLTIIEEVTIKNVDLIEAIRISMSKGWMKSDFEVRDGIAILNYFTGKEWTRSERLTKLPAIIKQNQFTEANYYNPRTKMEHFRRRNLDTLTSSVTVKEGSIRYYYIYEYKD